MTWNHAVYFLNVKYFAAKSKRHYKLLQMTLRVTESAPTLARFVGVGSRGRLLIDATIDTTASGRRRSNGAPDRHQGGSSMPTKTVEIVLARHGPCRVAVNGWVSGRDLGELMRRYDASGITRTVAPPSALRELGTRTACVVTSDLQRGVESAEWLAGDRKISIHPELREARCLPQSLAFPRVPPGLAIVIGWIGGRLNLCDVEETICATRLRAGRAVDLLTTLAEQHGTVLAVGHGMFNRFIARHLRRRGWRGPRLLPSSHWSCARYVRDVGTSPEAGAPTAPSI